ncbi:MAG: NUDIX domain-containing protein [bacterium]
MEDVEKIKIKAMCMFRKGDLVLVSRGFDKVTNEHFYRALGGSVNFFETGLEGVRREIDEELHSGIENLRFLRVVENLFEYEGRRGHEVTFLYAGDLAKKELYEEKLITIVEDTYQLEAEWILMSDFLSGEKILYPELNWKEVFESLN